MVFCAYEQYSIYLILLYLSILLPAGGRGPKAFRSRKPPHAREAPSKVTHGLGLFEKSNLTQGR